MLIKTIAGIALFAATGAAVGYSQVFCATGECQITGTPYGGALFGGMLGLAVMSSFTGKPLDVPVSEEDDTDEQKPGE